MVDLPETAALPDVHAAHLLDDVFSRVMPVASPTFVGHMTSSLPSFLPSLAKVLTALNQNVVKIETSAAMTALECQVIGMLHKLVFGQDDAFYRRWLHSGDHALGGFCSGGTVANLTALWASRNNLLRPRLASPESTASGSCRRFAITATTGSLSLYRSAGTIRCARSRVCLKSVAFT
ncbi:hypothetical protein IHE33_12820 (plasmid) [Mycetohabitans endofungorum]|uniref:hypothetical protein n=1 Tax=Mycetohabitans endofungorum TaxID=417203 RepID=UPI0030D34D6F